ncbi:MAG: FG-GAP-like repeat-containing protein [bacterium]
MKRNSILLPGFYLLFFIFFFAVNGRAVDKPSTLKCNGKTLPDYIESPLPAFSWTVNPGTATQNFYQVLVATSPETLSIAQIAETGKMWDSGKVQSISTTCYYDGDSALSGNAVYYWKVRVWEVENDTSPWSDSATFRLNFFLKGGSFSSGKIKSIASGDLDGDGFADLVLGTDSNGIQFWKNNKDGTFSSQGSAQAGKTIEGLAIKDLNNDGLCDIISACSSAQLIPIEVFLNDGNFEFHLGDTLSLSNNSRSVAVFDMDNDGNYDIIEGVYGLPVGENNAFYSGLGNGLFSQGNVICEKNPTVSIAAADFDNDGNFDIVSLNRKGSTPPEARAIVYKGNGEGSFEKVWWSSHPPYSGCDYFNAVAVGDINNDGNCDFIAATKAVLGDFENTSIGIYTGDGNFVFTRSTEIGGPVAHATSLALADLNNDGFLDLIVGWETMGAGNQRTRFYLNDGAGGFLLLDKAEEDSAANSFAMADFDGDGDLDYVSATNGGCEFFYSTPADDGIPNTPPASPASGGLTAGWENNNTKLHLTWGDGSDSETTDKDALQYNLLLRSETGIVVSTAGGKIFNEGAGFYGNMMYSSWTILNIDRKTYLFSVQTIDGQGAGSGFSDEKLINEKPYSGWDAEGVIPSTCCKQYSKDEIFEGFGSTGYIKIEFKIRDFEKNKCALTTFWYSLDGGGSWDYISDENSALAGFHPPPDYYFNSETDFESADAYSFIWNTKGTLDDILRSTYTSQAKVKFKAYDKYEYSAFCESGGFEIDNKKPTAPGDLTLSGEYTGAAIGLKYGTASFDENFDEYIIYYNDSPDVSEMYYLGKWSSENDTNLSSATFFGASGTTVIGLTENTTYHFILYAYDNFANCGFSAVTPPIKTNDVPFLEYVPAVENILQRTDGSGLVDFKFKGFDSDADVWDYVSVKVRKADGSTLIDAVPVNYDAGFSTPLFFCSTGTVNNYVFSATSTFGSAVCYNSAFVKIIVTDGINFSNEINNSNQFTIDTRPPEGITRFMVKSYSSTDVRLQWNLDPEVDFDEDNFSEYVVWYGSSPGVTNGLPFSKWDYSSQGSLENKPTRTASVQNLTPGLEYFFRLYVYDIFGNFCQTSEVSKITHGGPDSRFNSVQQESGGTGAVSINATCYNPDGHNSFLNVCFSTVSSGGPWSKVTFSTEASACYNGGLSTFTPGISNLQEYQVGTAESPILTTPDSTTTVSLVWNSREEIPDAYYGSVFLRAVLIDTYNVVQATPAFSGSFAVDNLDPSVLSGSYEHGKEVYSVGKSANMNVILNKGIEIASIDYAGLFISTVGFPAQTADVSILNVAAGEFDIDSSSTGLSFHLTESSFRQIAGFDRNGYEKIFLHALTGAFRDGVGNFSRAVSKEITWTRDEDAPKLDIVSYGQNPQSEFSGLKLEFDEEISGWAEDFGNEIYLSASLSSSEKITLSGGVTIDTETSKIYWLYPDEETHVEIIRSIDNLYFSCGRVCCDLSGNFLAEISPSSATMLIEPNPPKVDDWAPAAFGGRVSPVNLTIWVKFSERIYSKSITGNSFRLEAIKDKTGLSISEKVDDVNFDYTSSSCVLSMYPETLVYGYSYRVTISTSIQDLSLNYLQTDADGEEPHFEFQTLLDLSVALVISSGPVTVEISENALSGTGRIELPLNSSAENPKILAAFVKEDKFNDFSHRRLENGLVTINVFNENDELQTGNFQSPVWLYFGYDNNSPDDDFVDGEVPPVRVDSLAIYWLNEDRDFWVKIPSEIDKDASCVKAQLRHFSSYALIGGALYSVGEAHPYPVPYKKWEDNGPLPGIKFTFPGCSQAKIKIYDIMGRCLKEFSYDDTTAENPGIFTQWTDVTLPSGVYIYRILSGENEKSGKLIVIQ